MLASSRLFELFRTVENSNEEEIRGVIDVKVLIAGSNGTTGRHIVKQLASKDDYEVVAMVRKEEQSDQLLELGADQVAITDLESELDDAVAGMDAIIFAAGSGSKTGPDKTEAVDKRGAIKLMQAARKADVHHFVMLSSMGADDPKGELEHYLQSKGAADKYLMECGLTYTIVRPGRLTNDKGTGKVTLEKKIDDRDGRSIPREDVAAILTASLGHEKAKNKVFEVLSGDTAIEDAFEILK